MSEVNDTLKPSTNLLTATNHREWKERCEAAALSLVAYDILLGTESKPDTTALAADRRDYDHRLSKMSGYLLGTLDQAHRALLSNVSIRNPAAIWTALNNHYEKKDASTRFFATQKLMTITYRDPDHPEETLIEYGNRAVDAGNQLKALLPAGIALVQATATAVCNDTATHATTVTLVDATATEAFSASNLVDELVVSVIILGLGTSEDVKMVKYAVMHGTRTIQDALVHLQNAVRQDQSDNLAKNGPAALAAKTFTKNGRKPGEWKPFYCKEHGPNNSHATKNCKKLNPPKANAAIEEEERANIAEIAHLGPRHI